MKNKKIVGLTAMSLILGSTIATADASSNSVNVQMKRLFGISDGNFQAEKTAIENLDFASWKAAVENGGNSKILDVINESNFAKYAEAFKLRESGDTEGSRKIMEELGLKGGPGAGKDGVGPGNPVSDESRTAIENAIKNSDYSAWKAAMEESPAKSPAKGDDSQDFLTESNFSIIVQAYNLKESGDMEGAMELLKNNNIPGGMFLGGERGRHGGDDVSGVDQEALMETYKNKDYSAWKALMEERGGKILEFVTADNFSKFAEAKILQSEGNNDQARTILEELGFPFQDRGMKPERPEKPAGDAGMPGVPGASSATVDAN